MRNILHDLRPDFSKLPHEHAKGVDRALFLDLALHVEGLANHALVQLLLKRGRPHGAQVSAGAVAERGFNLVVRHVVAVAHHVAALAVRGVLAVAFVLLRRAAMDAPMLRC
jgi:hypothetical protein